MTTDIAVDLAFDDAVDSAVDRELERFCHHEAMHLVNLLRRQGIHILTAEEFEEEKQTW